MAKRLAVYIFISIVAAAVALGQPVVTGISNAASYQPAGLPASGIAQGSIFSVFGIGLGPADCAPAAAFPLPASICGVSLTVTVNGTSAAPIPLGTYGTQINAILPSNTPTGTGAITVTYQNQTSAAYPIQVANAAFGEFTPVSSGFGAASVTDQYNNPNSIVNSLHPGDDGVLWGTGLGPISGSDTGVPPVGPVGSPTVYVGNTPLTLGSGLAYAGRSPCCAGLDQINFVVPKGVDGCYVPIAVDTGGGQVGNIGTIAVSAVGTNTCSDSVMGQDLVAKLAAGNVVNFAYVRLERNAGVAIIDTLGDTAWATFSSYSPDTAFEAEYGVSSGYCVTNDETSLLNSDSSFYAATLDAGSPLNLSGGVGLPVTNWKPELGAPGFYPLQMTYSAGTFFYNGYPYTVSGNGGADVGPFSAKVTLPASITGLAQFSGLKLDQTIPRNSDFTVQWTGGDPTMQNGQVTIGGLSESAGGNGSPAMYNSFQCTAPMAAGSFTIPAYILSALPPSQLYPFQGQTVPLGEIWIGQYTTPVEFTAQGLDRGLLTDAFFRGLEVIFQ